MYRVRGFAVRRAGPDNPFDPLESDIRLQVPGHDLSDARISGDRFSAGTTIDLKTGGFALAFAAGDVKDIEVVVPKYGGIRTQVIGDNLATSSANSADSQTLGRGDGVDLIVREVTVDGTGATTVVDDGVACWTLPGDAPTAGEQCLIAEVDAQGDPYTGVGEPFFEIVGPPGQYEVVVEHPNYEPGVIPTDVQVPGSPPGVFQVSNVMQGEPDVRPVGDYVLNILKSDVTVLAVQSIASGTVVANTECTLTRSVGGTWPCVVSADENTLVANPVPPGTYTVVVRKGAAGQFEVYPAEFEVPVGPSTAPTTRDPPLPSPPGSTSSRRCRRPSPSSRARSGPRTGPPPRGPCRCPRG